MGVLRVLKIKAQLDGPIYTQQAQAHSPKIEFRPLGVYRRSPKSDPTSNRRLRRRSPSSALRGSPGGPIISLTPPPPRFRRPYSFQSLSMVSFFPRHPPKKHRVFIC